MAGEPWTIEKGAGPIVAAAIHNGSEVRTDVAENMVLDPGARLREEDPFTGLWTEAAPTRIVTHRSRFEVDLNRPRERAVYRQPSDAWDLDIWRSPPSEGQVKRSLELYDAFYGAVRQLFDQIVAEHGVFVLLDIHTYNHRRDGPKAEPADPAKNPEVNLGTGTMDRTRWAPVVDRFMADLGACRVDGRPLDVRENVKFQGGQLSRWVHETYPTTGCSLAVEFKKTFMDEWTAEPNETALSEIGTALKTTVPGLHDALRHMSHGG